MGLWYTRIVPRKNTVRSFKTGCFYHLYCRGIRKSDIFKDRQDYSTFLFLLKKYLDPNFREKRFDPRTGKVVYYTPDFVYEDVELLAYCLMPNHFHLLVKNLTKPGATKLMRRVISSYAVYFNGKYQLSGSPFDKPYRSVEVETEEQLLHLSRYIHANPKNLTSQLIDYPYSSYPVFVRKNSVGWLKTEDILVYFAKAGYSNSYREFTEKWVESKETKDLISDLLLDQS